MKYAFPFCVGLILTAGLLNGSPVVLDFETVSDSTNLTDQYPGVIFSNAVVLTAGLSLNEFEFPPHSGKNVVSDNGGPISINFASSIVDFSAYFTYAEPLTIKGFNASNSVVATAASLYSNDELLSGASGSTPNELVQFSFADGISRITITGDPAGGSFAMDDLTYDSTTISTAVPEPSYLIILCLAGAITVFKRLRQPAVLALLCTAGSTCVYAAHTIVAISARPTTAAIGTPVSITVTASITDGSLIAGSVNLLQIDSAGNATVIAKLNDDGLNGDVYAGDLVFSTVVVLNNPAASQIQFQVSAAFKGELLRPRSPVVSVFFQPTNAAQESLSALAAALANGDTGTGLKYVVPSDNTLRAFSTFDLSALRALAKILSTAALTQLSNDLRVFTAVVPNSAGSTSTVEITMVPGSNGQWLVNSW